MESASSHVPSGVHWSSSSPDSEGYVDSDSLRTKFALAMSAMYKSEVPLYGDLVEIVLGVNEKTMASRDDEPNASAASIRASSERLTLERHGAIRLGTPYELQTVRRIFTVLGMCAIGYYDLSVAGLPMHATCFRPKDVSSLDRNPFRVFTTLLRPELLHSDEAKDLAMSLLKRRKLFTDQLLEMLDIAESQGNRLTPSQAETFIPQSLLTFSWRPVAAATISQYTLLKAEHPILADITCFRSAHINHLAPRTLDISAAQTAMQNAGMAVKSRIEGPPSRKCPILLRQTSFLALEETVKFMIDEAIALPDEETALVNRDGLVEASHRARFGEIEERGAAVTAKGRELYDKLLEESMSKAREALGPEEVDAIMAKAFEQYPDDWNDLRRQGLIYCEFRCGQQAWQSSKPPKILVEEQSLLEALIQRGIIEASPITYEDFLPFSAAGIFQSNLLPSRPKAAGPLDLKRNTNSEDKSGLERAMGGPLIDTNKWYAKAQRRSLETCALSLGLKVSDLM